MIESITDSMGMNLRKLQEIVKDREAWRTITHRIQRVGHNLATEQQQHTDIYPLSLRSLSHTPYPTHAGDHRTPN